MELQGGMTNCIQWPRAWEMEYAHTFSCEILVIVFFLSHYLFRGDLLRMHALIQEHPASHSCLTHIYTSEMPSATTVLSCSSLEPLEAECTHALACFPVAGLVL